MMHGYFLLFVCHAFCIDVTNVEHQEHVSLIVYRVIVLMKLNTCTLNLCKDISCLELGFNILGTLAEFCLRGFKAH